MIAAFARRAQFVPLLHTKLLRFAEGDVASHAEGDVASHADASTSADDSIGQSPLRPLYHDFPAMDGAYQYKDTYLFCDDLVVAPITGPVDPVTQLAERRVWLPPGQWVELTSGVTRTGAPATSATAATSSPGGLSLVVNATINEVPVFARAGTVLALAPAPSPTTCSDRATIGTASKQPSQLLFEVYSGSGASAARSGAGFERVDSAYGRTDTTTGAYTLSADEKQLTFTASCASTGMVDQADGSRTFAPGSCEGRGATPRVYRVDFKFVAPALAVGACGSSSTDGVTIISSAYDARTLTQTVVFTPAVANQTASTTGAATTACVQLTKPAATSFVDPLVSTSRFVQLRGRAHRLKAVIDQV
jgi:hypothetical protein